jgi:hypothetical protein
MPIKECAVLKDGQWDGEVVNMGCSKQPWRSGVWMGMSSSGLDARSGMHVSGDAWLAQSDSGGQQPLAA